MWPPLPLPGPLPGVNTQVKDPFMIKDPWKAYVGTPTKTQRSHDVHSGMTPQLQRERQQLTDFLAGTESSLAPIPAPPMPQSDDTASVFKALLDGQAALLQGVNDLRANAVTRQHLHVFQELQSREMRTYVQAELAPIHNALRQQSAHVGAMGDRVARVESRLEAGDGFRGNSGSIDKNDPNHFRITFKGFTTESLDARFAIVKQFVEKVQGNDRVVGIDTRMSGPYTARKPTNETFAQFCSRDARDRVLQALKETSIKTANGNTIKVFRAKTEFIRSRDWAMGKSEELIKTKLETEKLSATVKYEKGKELRRITVDGEDAFVQRLTDAHGKFVGNFQDLQLP